MSLRILHITDSLNRTGLASQLLVLSRGLVEKGFEVHVAALQGRGPRTREFRAVGVETTELQQRWQFDPLVLIKLRRLLRRLRPDIVHAWNFDAAVYGWLTECSIGIKQFVVGQYRIDPRSGMARQRIDQRLSHRSSHLVTTSAQVRDWRVSQHLSVQRLTVIPPGVPPARATDVSRDEILRELKLPADARLIGVIGRLIPEKRVKDLIWAADLLRVLHDNLRLLVIGDGPLRPQLEQYARLASDLDHIRFLGERDDVWRIMPHLDVLWNASENRAHSIAILEAMAAGVPLIASDTPMNREIVVENETGYLVSPTERSGRADRARHTDRIFKDRDLAARLGENARRRASEQFSVEQYIQRHLDIYQMG